MLDKYFRPVILTLLYVIMSSVVAIAIALLLLKFNPDASMSLGSLMSSGDASFDEQLMSDFVDYVPVTILVTGLVCVGVARFMKMSDFRQSFDFGMVAWKHVWVALLGAILYLAVCDAIVQALDIPDNNAELFMSMSGSVCGMVTIAVIGPVFEELIFREAIIKSMLSSGASRRSAIIFSSLCFGLAHGNPAQVCFAFFVGLLFACIYIKTGNIILSSIAHILNNTACVILMRLCGGYDYEMATLYCIILVVVLSYPSYFLLHKFWKTYPQY